MLENNTVTNLVVIKCVESTQRFLVDRTQSCFARTGIHTTKLATLDKCSTHIVKELCESRGGRPGLSVLTSLLVSVDVKLY